MKYLTLLAIGIAFTLSVSPAYAVTPTPTQDTSTQQKLDKQINQLKDKIASRVSELNLVEKRGIIGTVEEVKGNQITLTDRDGNTRYIDVDEITKFSSPTTKTNFGISDLTKGTQVSALGLYNKQSKRILARFVDEYVVPTRVSGVISEVDKKNFQASVATSASKQTTIDVGSSTIITSYTKDAGEVKSGFSKLTNGDRVFVVGYPDKKDPSLLVVSRMVILADAPKNPAVNVESPTTEPTLGPTSAGAKNIQPVK